MRSLAEKVRLAAWLLVILSPCARVTSQELQPRSILMGHASPVYCVAVSPDGKSVASGARNGSVICWDVDAARFKWTVLAHKDGGNGYTQVLAVAFSPDGKTLASAGWDCKVRLWDSASGAPKRTLPHEDLVYSVAFSPDRRTLASGEHHTGAIHLWDLGTGKSTAILKGGVGSVWCVAISPDGKTLASGGYVVRQNGGGVVRIWDLPRRTPRFEFPAQPTAQVALSPDGQLVAGTGYRKRPDGHQIDGLVRLWNTRTGELRRSWTIVGDGRTSAGPIAFSPDGRLVAVGGRVGEKARARSAGEISLWDVESGRLLWKESCHVDDVNGLAFTPDGKILVSGGGDNVVKLWETERMTRPSR